MEWEDPRSTVGCLGNGVVSPRANMGHLGEGAGGSLVQHRVLEIMNWGAGASLVQ